MKFCEKLNEYIEKLSCMANYIKTNLRELMDTRNCKFI